MTAPRKPVIRDADREQVARMLLVGKTIRQVAKAMGRSTATIQADVHELRRQWKQRAGEHVQDLVANETAKLDEIERRQWELLERTNGVSAKGEVLSQLRVTVSTRCRILGLEVPADIVHLRQQLLDEKEALHRSVLDALKAEIRDPEIIRRIAQRLMKDEPIEAQAEVITATAQLPPLPREG